MNRNTVIGMLGIGLVMFGGYKLYHGKVEIDNPPAETVVMVPADESAAAMVTAPTTENPNGECMILVKGKNNEPDYIVGKCKD